jgi:hypothetical protein
LQLQGLGLGIAARIGYYTHLGSYVVVNLGLWLVWAFEGEGLPWPLFVMLGWGAGLLVHTINYSAEFWLAGMREREIEREIARERARWAALEGNSFDSYGKPKRHKGAVKLGADGELLTDDLDNDVNGIADDVMAESANQKRGN